MPDGPAYFTSRGSVLGQVPGTVVRRRSACSTRRSSCPASSSGGRKTDAATICQARTDGAVGQLRRILGDEPEGLDRVNELLARAVEPLRPEGRSLYAGIASLGIPDEPLAAAWRRGDMLREYRGDSHIAAWVVGRARRHRDRPADRAVLGPAAALLQPHPGVDRRAVRCRDRAARVPRADRRRCLHRGRPGAARGHRGAHRRPDAAGDRRPRRRRRRAVRPARARGASDPGRQGLPRLRAARPRQGHGDVADGSGS